MSPHGNTFFYDVHTKERLGSSDGILPITLYKGMKMTIHGRFAEHGGPAKFEVSDWEYHKGHEDEEAGLKILLINKSKNDVSIGFA